MANYSDFGPERQANAAGLDFQPGAYGAMGLRSSIETSSPQLRTLAADQHADSNRNEVYADDFDPIHIAGRRAMIPRRSSAPTMLVSGACALGGSDLLVSRRSRGRHDITATNPADLIWSTTSRPRGSHLRQLPVDANFNFDAQAESFSGWLLRKGLRSPWARDPEATHRLLTSREPATCLAAAGPASLATGFPLSSGRYSPAAPINEPLLVHASREASS